jgi:FkbM family methyltransferase
MGLLQTLRAALPPGLLVRARALDQYWFGQRELRYVARLCRPGKASIDVGANVGVFTYYMRRHSSRVYAYEPHPRLAEQLRATFRRGVVVLEKALSDRTGTATLRVPVDGGVQEHGLSSIAIDFAGERVDTFEVPLRRMDDEGYEGIGFIKIDVEQHEREVLRGAARLIERERPNLLVEVCPLLYGQSLPEVFGDLLQLGYRGWFCFRRELVRLEDYDPAVHANPANIDARGAFLSNLMLSVDRPPRM